jgi:hypothetical protein
LARKSVSGGKVTVVWVVAVTFIFYFLSLTYMPL